MGIVFRQSIKTSIVILVGAIIGIVYTYWQAKVMNKSEIGIFRNLINQGAMIQGLLLFGAHSISHTFVQRYAENDIKRGVLLGFSLLVPFLAWILFSIPYFLLRSWIVSMYQPIDQLGIIHFFYWLPILILLWSYITLFETYLLSKMKVALATFMREIVIRLSNLLLLILFSFSYIDFNFFVVATILCYAIPVIILAFIAKKATKIKLSLNWTALTKTEAKAAIHYAWYHSLIGASLNLIGFIDSIMLAPLAKEGTSALAVYGIAVFLIAFVNIPYKSMLATSLPKLNDAYINNSKELLFNLFNRANLNIVVATAFIGVLMYCNVHNATALLPRGYEDLTSLFVILLLGRLIDVSTGLNQEFIGITPYYKFTFWAALVYIVIAVVGNRIFIPKYGVYGAAWISTIGLAIYNIIKAVYLKRKFGLYPFEKRGLWIYPIAAIGCGVSYLIPKFSNPFVDGLIRTPIVAIIMIALLLWLKPSEDVKEYWQTVKKKKRLF